jgi:hypothetical protein
MPPDRPARRSCLIRRMQSQMGPLHGRRRILPPEWRYRSICCRTACEPARRWPKSTDHPKCGVTAGGQSQTSPERIAGRGSIPAVALCRRSIGATKPNGTPCPNSGSPDIGICGHSAILIVLTVSVPLDRLNRESGENPELPRSGKQERKLHSSTGSLSTGKLEQVGCL